jgi:hypothetical protein
MFEGSFSDESWGDDATSDSFLPFSDDEGDHGETVDLEQFLVSARRKLIFHRTCTLGPARAFSLQLEAELSLANHDFESALVCALAADLLLQEERSRDNQSAGKFNINFFNDDENLAMQAVKMIAMYQLGDRDSAVDIMGSVEQRIANSPESVSVYLRNKFQATCEVLNFMPQLLSMLKQADKRQ